MSEAGLDQLVKGSPPPNVSLPSVAAAAVSASPDRAGSRLSSPAPSDPTSLLPSSPPQIYLNLLILEASLRSQYLTLRARRRQHTFILFILSIWTANFFWAQFLRPREDGTGVGGSVYWLVDMLEKIALIGGLVMGVLFRLTGQWERGVRWPSKWLRTTNRGLRGMNCKIVVLKGAWWKEVSSLFGFLFPVSWFVETPGSNYQYIEYASSGHGHERRSSQLGKTSKREKQSLLHHELAEEDIAPGGDYIKILLLPKHFTPEFRENWEMYRSEYWEQENHRRSDIRAKLRAQQRQLAKKNSPWLWWVPSVFAGTVNTSPRQPMKIAGVRTPSDGSSHLPSRAGSQRTSQSKRSSMVKTEKSHLGDMGKETSHSRSSSRSSVSTSPNLASGEFDDARERRLSTSSIGTSSNAAATDARRRRKVGSQDPSERRSSIHGPPARVKASATGNSRPSTPTADASGGSSIGGTTLRSKGSTLSAVSRSSGSEQDRERDSPRKKMESVRIKKEEED